MCVAIMQFLQCRKFFCTCPGDPWVRQRCRCRSWFRRSTRCRWTVEMLTKFCPRSSNLNRPTVLFSSNGASVSLQWEICSKVLDDIIYYNDIWMIFWGCFRDIILRNMFFLFVSWWKVCRRSYINDGTLWNHQQNLCFHSSSKCCRPTPVVHSDKMLNWNMYLILVLNTID